MNRKLLIPLSAILFSAGAFAQVPGGVATGLTAWYRADAGTTLGAGNVVNSWSNQTVNANLTNLTPTGGNTTYVDNDGAPFNFNAYFQHNASALYKASSVTYTDVLAANAGSMIGVGTVPDQLISLSSSSTSAPSSNNRANSGTRGGRTEFGGNTSTQGHDPFAAGIITNSNKANVFGFRASTSAVPAQENTYNGLKAIGTALARPTGSYRFAIGSFPGYFYGTNKSAEAVCYNRQLTADEFARVESYFAVKYGLTLGSTASTVNYLSSSSTIVWTGDAVYQNNITGIGRDDTSGLLQKQSHAVTDGGRITVYNDDVAGIFPAMNADNTTAFTTDNSFFITGDNNADTLLNICAAGGKIVRMARVWKKVTTGTVGNVSVAIDDNTFSPDVTTLIYSSDNTFPEASTTIVPLIVVGTKRYAVMPAGGGFFTFAGTPLDITTDVVNLTCAQTSGGSMTANVTGGAPPYAYSWNTTPVQNTATATNVPVGNYTITVTHGNGCTYSATASMNSNVIILDPDLTATGVKCAGQDNGIITVNVLNGTPTYTYSLNNQNNFGTSNVFNNLPGGFYRVYVKDQNGCNGNDTITVTEPSPLSLELSTTDDYCENGSEPNGYADVLMTGGTIPYSMFLNGYNIGPTLKITNLGEGDYTLLGRDNNGCEIQDTFSIEHVPCCLVWLPNAFTPNGDSKNDVFEAKTTGRVILNKLAVYNRYGQIVFSSFNWNKGWDGTMNGKPVDAGTYFYSIKYVCESFTGPKEQEMKGDIVLIR